MVESSCVIQVGYEVRVKEEDMPDVSSARIFRVPKLPRASKRPFVQSTSCLNRPFSLWEEGAARNAHHSYETQVPRFEYVECFYEEESAFKWKYDAVFDVDLQNRMRERLMTDILLFENQIPLWVLKDLLKFQTGSAEAAKQKVEHLMSMLLWRGTRHEVFLWKARVSYNMYYENHVLGLVYRSMVGRDVEELLDLPPASRNRMQICLEKCFGSMKAICRR
ncbi:hypothetical protein SUGI_1174080 [Cryptomeria japonica]|nr:hypothetical protein SUGI_1174080 [Cryptomeria japonica]